VEVRDADVCAVDEGPPVVEGDFEQGSIARNHVVVGHVGADESAL
jgi:hypothetical protein